MVLKILWLAPNFNHYKARFLNHLAKEKDIVLTILSGSGREAMGDAEINELWEFEHIIMNVSKKDFGKSKIVKHKLTAIFGDYNWILIPAEKKNIPLFLMALRLKKTNPKVRLFSYNHAQLKSKNRLMGFLDRRLTRFYNNKLDRVIYYSEASCNHSIQQKLVPKDKAFWANNTLDNIEIEKHYSFQLPPEELTILFIGRLIPSKRIEDVIKYYILLKIKFPELKLEIIGDGPESPIVKQAVKLDDNIIWHGTIVDEDKIAPIMRRTSFVFIPGLSGLSINHAFAYGRPYLTLKADKHGPELSYIGEGENGYILNENSNEVIERILELLSNRTLLVRLCHNAYEKGKQLSVQNWVKQMKYSLWHE